MRKFPLLLVLYLGLLVKPSTVAAQSISTKLSNELQRNLDSLVGLFNNTKSVSAAVYVPGNGIWKGASGLSYIGKPISSDMLFGIASNSKLFTAVVLLKLQEDNILSLDDSLRKWLPTYKNVNPNITIRQLLNHTSGVSDPLFVAPLFDSIQANLTRVYTPSEILSYLGAPSFAPGAAYGYSNVNYILAGMVAEKATGDHISKLIRTKILDPLKMDSTFYDVEESERGTIAHRWYSNKDFHDSSRISLNTAGGAAGSIFSTASEMVQWYNGLFNSKIINQTSINEMINFSKNGSYGLGIQSQTILGHETWGHGGRTLGYKSRMFYDPCMKIVTCGLSNSDPSAIDGITALLHKVLLDKLPECPTAISGTTKACANSGKQIYVIHPIGRATSYQWINLNGDTINTTSNSISILFDEQSVSGTISVRGFNEYGYGLQMVLDINVEQIQMNVRLLGVSVLTANSALQSYQWLNCDSNYSKIEGATNYSYQVKNNGRYAVAVKHNFCSDTSECVMVDLSGVEDLHHRNITISPNPFFNRTFVSFKDGQLPIQLILTNSLGQTVKVLYVSERENPVFQLDGSDLCRGLYHLEMLFDDQTKVNRKLMVE